MAADADGGLITGSIDNTLRMWAKDGTAMKVFAGHQGSVAAVIVLPDGRIASSSHDGTVRMWEADGSRGFVFRGHPDLVHCLCAIPICEETGDNTMRPATSWSPVLTHML